MARLENYTFLTLRFSMQRTNVYAVAKELILKGFSNIQKNAVLKSSGESAIVFRPISEITATMEESFYPFVIADTFRIAAMNFDES